MVHEVPERVSLLVMDAALEQVPVEANSGTFISTRAVAQFLVC